MRGLDDWGDESDNYNLPRKGSIVRYIKLKLVRNKIMNKNMYVEIGLINPKSPTNVGAVMRAAGCYQVNSVKYTGERYARAAKFNTDTKNRTSSIPLTGLDNILEQLPKSRKIICVDLIEGAIALPHFEHPEDAIYVFGPEDGTIPQNVVDAAHASVYVPTIGCMNLAATVNVVLYDRLAKDKHMVADDSVIRSSRDTNNKVKVK